MALKSNSATCMLLKYISFSIVGIIVVKFSPDILALYIHVAGMYHIVGNI